MAKRVILRLAGGHGNQLFQYAAARRLAYVNNAELVLDTVSEFKRDKRYRRTFGLRSFDLAAREATFSEKFGYFPSIKKWILKKSNFLNDKYLWIEQSGNDFDPSLLALRFRDTLWLKGVWASEDYFSDIAPLIRAEIKPNPIILQRSLEIIQCKYNKPTIGIHIRNFGMEYSNNNNADLPIIYYENAIKYFNTKYYRPNFILFSDVPILDKNLIQGLGAHANSAIGVLSGQADPMLDLHLMSQCHGLITANSTFSWWAAWLGEGYRMRGEIVVPDPMKYNTSNWNFSHLIPDRWHKI
jgi:hypothetical protein